nr:RnfABCDGE type electron transport complex subunit D [Spirochaetota bacterium]
MRVAFVSARKRLGTVQAPFFRYPDRYYISMGVLGFSLLPIYISAVGSLGYKILLLLVLSCAAGIVTETLCSLITKRSVGYFGIGAWLLFPLMVPPGLPLWMSISCFAVSLIIAQSLFGGFGRHMVHPAVFGQLFIMINFAKQFNSSFIKPFSNPLFGFNVFSSMSFTDKTSLKFFAAGETLPLKEMLAGPHVGLIFEIFPYIVLISGVVYLIFGDVNYRTPIAFITTFSL